MKVKLGGRHPFTVGMSTVGIRPKEQGTDKMIVLSVAQVVADVAAGKREIKRRSLKKGPFIDLYLMRKVRVQRIPTTSVRLGPGRGVR